MKKKAAENMTPKEFVQQIAETNRNNIRQLITEERLVQIGTSVTTGKDTVGLGDGIARIKAPKKNQDRDAVYLISKNRLIQKLDWMLISIRQLSQLLLFCQFITRQNQPRNCKRFISILKCRLSKRSILLQVWTSKRNN